MVGDNAPAYAQRVGANAVRVTGEAQSAVQICAERRGLQRVFRRLLVVRVCLADTTSCEEVVSYLVPNLAVCTLGKDPLGRESNLRDFVDRLVRHR